MTISKPRIPPIITPIAYTEDGNANEIWYRFFNNLLDYIVLTDPWPEAPDDGQQYGRQFFAGSMQWTVVNPWIDAPYDGNIYGRRDGDWAIVDGSDPAPPNFAVQWNNSGAFGGSEEFLFKVAERTIIIGAVPISALPEWTVKPELVTSHDDGIDLTIKAGATSPVDGSSSAGGDLTLWGGDSATGAPGSIFLRAPHTNLSGLSGGNIYLYGGNQTRLGGTVGQNGGGLFFYGGESAQESGGRVDIYGGYGTNALAGAGGPVTITGGRGANTGAALNLYGGQSDGNPGANVNISGGTGSGGANGVVQIGTQLSLMKSGLTTIRGAPISFQTTGATAPVSPGVGNLWGLADGLYYRTTSGTINITDPVPNNSVTYAKIQDVSAASRLLGRGSAAGSGDVEEISLGTGLSMVGTTLSASGGSAGGSSTQLQYNNAGALGGISGVTTDGTNLTALTVTGAKSTFAASVAGYASINLPHGTAPSSPGNGDLWTTTAGLYARVNGTTVGPFVDAAGAGGAPTNAQYVTLATDGTLTNERVLTAGTGISITDGGAGSAVTVAANSNGFLPGGVPGLAAWYEANMLDEFLADGATLNVWPNLIASGWEPLVAINTPTFKTSIKNGQDVVRFDGSSNYMSARANTQQSIDKFYGFTFIIVCAPDNASTLLTPAGRAASPYEYQFNLGSWPIYQSGGSNNMSVNYGSNPGATTWTITAYRARRNTQVAMWRNGGTGVYSTSVTGSPSDANTAWYVGQRGDSAAGNWFDGDIAEMLWYPRALSLAELDAITSYLSTKYSITVTAYA